MNINDEHEYVYMTMYDDVWCQIHGVKKYNDIPTSEQLSKDISDWHQHGFNGLRFAHMHKSIDNCPICKFSISSEACRNMDFFQLEIRSTPDDSGVGHLITWKPVGELSHISKMFWDWCKMKKFKKLFKQ